MAAYADWTFYSTEYLGTQIAEADFPALALRASAIIDQITFDRVASIIEDDADDETIEKILMAVCVIAETMQTQLQGTGGKEIASESVGGHSVSYATNRDMELTALERLRVSAKTYLGNTGLMYQGFASGEYGGAVDAN